MKYKSLFLVSSFLLLFTASLWAVPTEVKRIVNKNFKVKPNCELQVNNRYGFIVIKQWNKNEIDFSIEIIGKGENHKVAQRMADQISVDFHNMDKLVQATTQIDRQHNNCKNCGITINYTINVPASAKLNLTNKYGNIQLDETTQPFRADVKYGNLYAAALKGTDNEITIKYGNVELSESEKLSLNIGYGNARMDKMTSLNLISAYSKFNIGTVGSIEMTSKYDRFTIKSIDSFVLSSAYTDFSIDYLGKRFNASSLKYCKVKIADVAQDFSSILIEAAYTNIRIGLDNHYSFMADLYTRYGSIRLNGIKLSDVTLDDDDSRYSKTIRGRVGKQEHPSAKVNISNSYADIIFSK